jgi:hypothetical protein
MEVFATKKSVHNLESSASKGPLTNEGDNNADKGTGEETEESGDIEHKLPALLSMTAHCMQVPSISSTPY